MYNGVVQINVISESQTRIWYVCGYNCISCYISGLS